MIQRVPKTALLSSLFTDADSPLNIVTALQSNDTDNYTLDDLIVGLKDIHHLHSYFLSKNCFCFVLFLRLYWYA